MDNTWFDRTLWVLQLSLIHIQMCIRDRTQSNLCLREHFSLAPPALHLFLSYIVYKHTHTCARTRRRSRVWLKPDSFVYRTFVRNSPLRLLFVLLTVNAISVQFCYFCCSCGRITCLIFLCRCESVRLVLRNNISDLSRFKFI